MSQWAGQSQPGYQYPMQTGFPGANPQFQQHLNPQFQPHNTQAVQQASFGPGGLVPQATGFPGARLQGFQPQPQTPGFQSTSGFLQSQPTGYAGPGGNFQQRSGPVPAVPPVPPVPPLATQYQQQNQSSAFLGLPQQQQQPGSFLNTPSNFTNSGLVPQQTGFPGRAGGLLVPQVTGWVDPRLHLMTSTFMPSVGGSFGATPQLAPPQVNLQQSFQQQSQPQQMSWALSRAEKKQYNDIFRAWDAQNTGFIGGQTALEVFGASGLAKDDLARIWTLADIDDRGKLNISEFHVAMALIYRRLSGMPIPDKLPAELVPPSSRDLDSSVDLVKDLLKNESRARSPAGLDAPVSRLKNRSLNSPASVIDSGRDATIYKHVDTEPPGGFYQPRSRHVNRDDVRSRLDEDSPNADLSDMKRRLANTVQMLDRAAEADAARTAEDEELEREMEDLKYRVKRVSEDLEYVSKGPRTAAKDQEKRQLERELLALMHEKVPEVERKMKAREERREREKREWTKERDRRNEKFGRYDGREESRYDDRERPYSRGYDRDRYDRDDGRDRDRGTPHRARSRSRDRKDYDPPRSPPIVRSARPPSPPPASAPRPAPTPSSKASPPPAPSKMTPEERQAFARAEAQRRIQARMAALGVTAPSSAGASLPTIDTSVEDRLRQERVEAEEKAKLAEKQAEDREKARKERLDNERALTEGRSPSSPAPPTSISPSAATKTVPAVTTKTAPPPPKPRARAPPPPRRPVAAPKASVPPPAQPAPAEPIVDPEEEALRAREETIKKQREARAERLRQLEREEAEAKAEEQRYQARLLALKNKPAETTPPVASPAPPAPAVEATKSTNPFSRLISPPAPVSSVSAPPSAAAGGAGTGTNPWAHSQLTPSSVAPAAPPAPPAPAASAPTMNRAPVRSSSVPAPPKSPGPKSYHTAPSSSIDDDWDDIQENCDGDSSDDELAGRGKREDIARQLFGGMLPTSRPTSTAPPSSASAPVPPPASQAPAPLPPPSAPVIVEPPGDRGALLQSIQGGLKLRRVVTVDKSGPPMSGRVLGDSAPPAHINTSSAVRAASPPVPSSMASSYSVVSNLVDSRSMYDGDSSVPELPGIVDGNTGGYNRQSVGWFAERAADAGRPVEKMPSTTEEDEEDGYQHVSPSRSTVPVIQIEQEEAGADDPMADIDKSIEHRARTVYVYEGNTPEDLSFGENLILTAHPSKSGSDWWYGTLVTSGRSGLFPKTFVQTFRPKKVKALYSYITNSSDELAFEEGDELSIIDTSEEGWWKAEYEGVVFIVPAAYLEAVEGIDHGHESPTSVAVNNVNTAGDYETGDKMTPIRSNSQLTTPTTLPLATREEPPEDLGEDEIHDSSSDYLSFDESEDEDVRSETEAEWEAREHERQLVLEAAGLIFTQAKDLPPSIVRKRSTKQKPPPVPAHRATVPLPPAPKVLPPVPYIRETEPESDQESAGEPEINHASHLDDAFERYKTFKQKMANRLSVASTVSADIQPAFSPTQPTLSPSCSSRFSGSQTPHLQPEHVESNSIKTFMQWLGRTRTPDGGESSSSRKSVSVSIISAPIPMASNSSGSMDGDVEDPPSAASLAFGTSWASLVDPTALAGIPSQERRRQEAIFELINTEAAYVRDLQLIVEIFYSSMLPLLSPKAVTVIFANIEDILLTNTRFLSVLEERQKECRLYMDKIGDIMLDHLPNLAVYMEYCVNQATATKALKSLRDTNSELETHLQRLRDDPAVRNLDLSSYLLVPMQRITRYPLLIKQVLKYTENEEEKHDVETAVDISERLLGNINESIRDQEGRAKLKALSEYLWIGQGRLDLTAPTRYMGSRRLLMEGPLLKARSGRRLYGFLCTDILVLTDESQKSLYRMPIPLAHARVNGTRDDNTFEVSQAYPRGGDTVNLKASSARECQTWIQKIEDARRRCHHAEELAVSAAKLKKAA